MEYINNEQNEINSNKYSVKCILVTVLILYLTWILNILNIFIIDSSIFLICVIGSTIIALVTVTKSIVNYRNHHTSALTVRLLY